MLGHQNSWNELDLSPTPKFGAQKQVFFASVDGILYAVGDRQQQPT
jgi:hypothetical protein